jgi:hypothetical protein
MDRAQQLVDHIARLQMPTYRLQQHAPRLVRVHPNDMALIESHCKGDPPMLNGSVVEVSEDVAEGSPEVIE